jgi:hypothetical protein
MLPCPITVYTQAGKTRIGAMRPTMLGEFFPDKGIEPVAQQVEKVVLEIVNESAR